MFNSREMNKANRFFSWSVRGSDCNYYSVSGESLKVYSEFRTGLDAFPCLFELVKGDGGFTVKFYFGNDSGAVFFDKKETREAVANYFVERILSGTTLTSKWEEQVIKEGKVNPKIREDCQNEVENHKNKKEELRKILRQKVEEFIG
jgi:hypothetical protein